MAETLSINNYSSKSQKYASLIPQLIALVETETDKIANLANIAGGLKQAFGFFWVGFYLDSGSDLVLGPYQGPIACTRIPYNKGVCGYAFSENKTVLVPDVEAFPGHIACSSESKSEIVLILKNTSKKAIGVLDIDSDSINDFDETDQKYLEELLGKLAFKF
jgi:L-methionine (R)-S-oxide reductase